MKTIFYDDIVAAVVNLTSALTSIMPSAKRALERALDCETEQGAKFALSTLLKNADVAECNNLPVCQDTGMAVFFVELGQDVHISGGALTDAINYGVRKGYLQNGYRASVLDPLTRVNTGDNTPAIVHVEIVEGENMKITFLPKGFGSENMSRLYMLKPSDGIDGVKRCVVEAVKSAGANPCPPLIVGVGIGGTSDMAMLLAKKQLLREVGSVNDDAQLASLEEQLKDEINALGIGAQGFGGKTTALDIHIGKYPTHLAALPVGINIQCNAARLSSVTL